MLPALTFPIPHPQASEGHRLHSVQASGLLLCSLHFQGAILFCAHAFPCCSTPLSFPGLITVASAVGFNASFLSGSGHVRMWSHERA